MEFQSMSSWTKTLLQCARRIRNLLSTVFSWLSLYCNIGSQSRVYFTAVAIQKYTLEQSPVRLSVEDLQKQV